MPLIDDNNLSVMDEGFMAKADSSGLIGHPWWVPPDTWKYWDYLPFVTTEALGEVYKSLMHEIK